MLKTCKLLCLLLVTTIFVSLLPSVAGAADTQYDVRMQGIYQIRDTITAVHEGLGGTVQWQIAESEEGPYSDIADATGDTYLVADEYAGKWLRFSVTSGDDVVYAPARKIADALPIPVLEDLAVTGAQWYTPAENTFKVGDKTFILLETTESDSAKFYILTKDFYGKHAANTKGDSNLYDEEGYGIHEWLNGEFLENGNSSYIVDESENNRLPEEIVSHIDRNRVWLTEPRNGEGTLLSSVGGVSLLSLHEINQYLDKVGFADDLWVNGGTPQIDTLWSLRTSDSMTATIFTVPTNPANASIRSFNAAVTDLAVRPAFYLDKDFFAQVKVSEIGANVVDVIKNTYTRAELSKIYSEEELETLFGFKPEWTITSMECQTEENGEKLEDLEGVADFNIRVQVALPSELTSIQAVGAVYDDDGLVGLGICSVGVGPDSDGIINIPVSSQADAQKNEVKVMLLDGFESMKPLTEPKALRFGMQMQGIYQIRDTITAEHEGIDGTVQWQIAESEEGPYSDISEATGDTYVVADEYAGKWLRFSLTEEGNTYYAPARKISDALLPLTGEPMVPPVDGVVDDTPPENTFQVEDKTFILLDVTESNTSKFYILTKDFYGTHWVNSVADNDYSNDTGIFKWLNSDFLTYGNSGNNQLPKGIVDYIDTNHVWLTEPKPAALTEPNAATGGVGLLSAGELRRYTAKIGWGDDLGATDTLWSLRTPLAESPGNIAVVPTLPGVDKYGKINGFTATEGGLQVRPAFYLGEDFFAKVKITNAGENVKRVITEHYQKSDFDTSEYLVKTDQVPDMFGTFYQETFKNGGICAFDIHYVDPYEAVRVIREAGGLPVLAHSGQQQNFSLIPRLVEMGLAGLELSHPANSEKDRQIIREYAQRFHLFLTGGSDFHGKYEASASGLGSCRSEQSGAAVICG